MRAGSEGNLTWPMWIEMHSRMFVNEFSLGYYDLRASRRKREKKRFFLKKVEVVRNMAHDALGDHLI